MPVRPRGNRKQHNKWLVVIAAYKFLQALLFIAIGVGAIRLVGQDVGDAVQQFAQAMHFNPESHLVNFLLDKASLVDDKLLRRIGALVFIYAGLSLAEGIGLYREKAWGEVLTLLITGSFLPLEIVEVAHRVTWIRIALLVVNALVFLYLLKMVAERRKQMLAERAV